MNIENIKAFMVVVKMGSITRASQELHISQPALSSQINHLEKYFKTPLLYRTAKGVSLTSAGEILYTEGSRLLTLLSNTEKNIDKLKNPENEHLEIAASSTIGGFVLPALIYNFKENYSQGELSLAVHNTSKVMEKVINRDVQVGLIEGPVSKELRKRLKREGLDLKRLGNDHIVLTAPYQEPWIDRSSIRISELMELNLILKGDDSGIRATVEKKFSEKDISMNDLKVILEVNDNTSIISAVSAGKGFSLLPKMTIKKELKHKLLKELNIEGMTFPHTFTIVYNPMETSSGLSKEFLAYLMSGGKNY